MSKHLPGPHFEELCETLSLYNDSAENYYKLSSLKDSNMLNGLKVGVNEHWKRNQYNLCKLTTYENCKDKLMKFTLSESPNLLFLRMNDDKTYESCKIQRMSYNEMTCYQRIKTTTDKFELISLKRVILLPHFIIHSIDEVIQYENNEHKYNLVATFRKLRKSERLMSQKNKDILLLPYMYPH